ncbi:hypothetical protein [Fischerella sp. PCC 9605]|uniref:hypothetical protein n=1 Tax=Fischerella sp. PCC 9605 TaxID=1173024 RepID=UPI0004B68338|nr:hypothetical protein [Fischerella sp. PCC 9605]
MAQPVKGSIYLLPLLASSATALLNSCTIPSNISLPTSSPTPIATQPTPTPNETQSTTIVTESTPTPNETQPTPIVTQPTPTPNETQPTPTPEKTQPTPTTSTTSLRVVEPTGTYLKRRVNWYKQSPEIVSESQMCYVKQNEELPVLSYKEPEIPREVRNIDEQSKYYGNVEKPEDYWAMTFENLPSRCNNQQNGNRRPTWFVYKKHVEIAKQ